jgi:hypothetical protein
VINLFDLAKRYEAGEPDMYIKEYVNKHAARLKNYNSLEVLNFVSNEESERSEFKINSSDNNNVNSTTTTKNESYFNLMITNRSLTNLKNKSQNYFNDESTSIEPNI